MAEPQPKPKDQATSSRWHNPATYSMSGTLAACAVNPDTSPRGHRILTSALEIVGTTGLVVLTYVGARAALKAIAPNTDLIP